jgi:hypothetical protein
MLGALAATTPGCAARRARPRALATLCAWPFVCRSSPSRNANGKVSSHARCASPTSQTTWQMKNSCVATPESNYENRATMNADVVFVYSYDATSKLRVHLLLSHVVIQVWQRRWLHCSSQRGSLGDRWPVDDHFDNEHASVDSRERVKGTSNSCKRRALPEVDDTWAAR